MRRVRRSRYKWQLNEPSVRAQMAALYDCRPEDLVIRRMTLKLRFTEDVAEKLERRGAGFLQASAEFQAYLNRRMGR